jgi:ankyrin repeat protein
MVGRSLEHPGIDINIADDQGRTPLWWAAAGGHLEAVRLLCAQRGIKRKAMDFQGKTPYAIAKDRGHVWVRGFFRAL